MREMRARFVPLSAAWITAAALTSVLTGPAGATLTGSAPVLRPKIAARHPHDPAAFTQGLQYLGGGLLAESTGQIGESGVRRVDLKTGKVLAQAPTPIDSAFGEGLTVLNGVMYHLTWQTGIAFAFDAGTLREIGRYRHPGEGWGLTNDGRKLIMSDGSSTLFWRDPRTFAVTRTLRVTDGGQPVKNLNELEYVQGSVYANVWLSTRIARIDPKTGRVTAWIDVQDLMQEASGKASAGGRPLTFDDVPNGIAFVPERGTLLLGGKRWPLLFEVKVPGIKAGGTGTGQPGR